MSFVGDALALQEGAQDLVGRARIDVVGAEQDAALGAAAFLAHQVLDRGDRLLVRRGAGVEHVLRRALRLRTAPGRTAGRSAPRTPAAPTCATPRSSSRTRRRPCPASAAGGPFRRTAASWTPGRRRPARACLPSTPPLALISSIVISATSFSDGLADRHRAGQRVQDADLDRVGGSTPIEKPGSGNRRRRRCMLQEISAFHGGPRKVAWKMANTVLQRKRTRGFVRQFGVVSRRARVSSYCIAQRVPSAARVTSARIRWNKSSRRDGGAQRTGRRSHQVGACARRRTELGDGGARAGDYAGLAAARRRLRAGRCDSMKRITVSRPCPVFRLVKTNGRSPRIFLASRSITSSEAPTMRREVDLVDDQQVRAW